MQHIAAYRSSGTIEPIMITLMQADDLTYPSFPSLGATFINKETVSIGLLSFFLQASLTYTSMLLWSFIGLWSHKKSGTKEQQKATCVPKMVLSVLIFLQRTVMFST